MTISWRSTRGTIRHEHSRGSLAGWGLRFAIRGRYRPGLPFLLLALFIPFAWAHFAAYPALCAQVTVAWDENTESDVAGYRVHYGTSSGGYNHSLDAGAFTSCVISGLDEGITYYFAATAYDSQDNESNYSEEISFTIPLADDGGDGGGDDGSGDADPSPDSENETETDSNDLAVASSGSADTESSSTCFIGTCAADPGFFSRIRRSSK